MKTKKTKIIDIDLTGYAVQSYPHPDLQGWQLYRIEYGGCNENCYYEGMIWLPPEIDPFLITKFFEIIQIPKARKNLEKSINNIHKNNVGKKSNWKNLENL